MNKTAMQRSLDLMLTVRERELERRSAELARKQALGERLQASVQRLDALAASRGQGGLAAGARLDAGLALNQAAYQQGVRDFADSQRQELALHEADTAATRSAVQALACRQEVLGQVLSQSLAQSRLAEQRRAQKGQDELAGQVWLRGRT
ncbi:hypothetical protein PFX98_21275 [Paucibacter sediminis]|uniref:Flagellar FliJ protein n=1 Tax=Paucibacter sediminis TaxID=3019553 RepID=A0AA95NI80_9BURK|nr:hypothetical protein [Paucibacter sp. S2-9]WIT11401.1 hypothetical protein PFX98_21275 [Paucibacter sp. S2-9]